MAEAGGRAADAGADEFQGDGGASRGCPGASGDFHFLVEPDCSGGSGGLGGELATARALFDKAGELVAEGRDWGPDIPVATEWTVEAQADDVEPQLAMADPAARRFIASDCSNAFTSLPRMYHPLCPT